MDKKATPQLFIALFLSIALGFLVWSFSKVFTGNDEPWDSYSSYYYIGLFLAALVPGLIGNLKQFWIWPIGVCAGELLFVVVKSLSESNPELLVMLPMTILFTLVGSLPAWIGSLVGAVLAFLIKRKEAK